MKNHFQQTKYKSFQRQLNLWGFERNTKESIERGSYHHPLFIKGRKDFCQEMGRQKSANPSMEVAPMKASAEGAAEQAGDAYQVSGLVTSSLQSSTNPSVACNNDLASLASIYNYGSANTPSQFLTHIVSSALAAQKQRQEEQQQNQLASLQALLQGSHEAARNTQLAAALWNNSAPPLATNSSSVVDALRLKGTNGPAGGMIDSLDVVRQLLLGGSIQQPQQHMPQFLSTTNPAPTASTTGNPLAQADADIIQALKRRAAIEQLLRGNQQQQRDANTPDVGSFAKLFSSLS
jgi:hypothetical protein